MAKFMDVLRTFRKLSPSEEENATNISSFLSKKDAKYSNTLVKQRKIEIILSASGLSKKLIGNLELPQLVARTSEPEIREYVEQINSQIWDSAKENIFEQFSNEAVDNIPAMIAESLVGFEYVKKAVALQLFSKERFHILLLGDPGTGKTRVLKAATDISPISSFGLGSGTTGAGLAVTVKGKEVIKGLLPMANGGLCAIDELNLMKEDSRASLYSAMEDGFVAYSKGGHHERFDAKVSVLATANPIGDKFKGSSPEELKKQLPFDAALLTRFHLTFILRKPNLKQFKEISKSLLNKKNSKISDADLKFLRAYLDRANSINHVKLPKHFETEIVDFIAKIKESEDKYLIEVSPRMVVGFMIMSKAAARMELRDTVHQNDIELVKQIISDSLIIK